MQIGHVKKWSEFQHYKDRSPPWIKLHRKLLDNLDYFKLSGQSAKALPLIWLIASEEDGALPEVSVLAFRLRTSEKAAIEIVEELTERGFIHSGGNGPEKSKPGRSWPSRHIPDKVRIAVFQRDNGCCVWCKSKENIEFDHKTPVSKGGESIESNIQLLCRSCNRKKRAKDAAQAEQLATQIQSSRSLETEVEIETELSTSNEVDVGICDPDFPLDETEDSTRATDEAQPAGGKAPADRNLCPLKRIVELYHQSLPELPRVEKLTKVRAGYIQQRWREDLPHEDAWRSYFADVRRSRFLMGMTQGRDGKPPFRADLEWLTRPGNFAKVAEGKYHS